MVKDLPANARDSRDAGAVSVSGKIQWSRKWQPLPLFLPGKFHGQRSLVGYCPCGHKELDMTEPLTLSYFQGKEELVEFIHGYERWSAAL